MGITKEWTLQNRIDAYLASVFPSKKLPQGTDPATQVRVLSETTVFPRLPRLPWCSPWRWASHPSRWRDWVTRLRRLAGTLLYCTKSWSWLYGKHWKHSTTGAPISSSTYLMVFQHPAVLRVDFAVCWALKADMKCVNSLYIVCW